MLGLTLKYIGITTSIVGIKHMMGLCTPKPNFEGRQRSLEPQDVFNQLGMLWCNRGGHKVRCDPFSRCIFILLLLSGPLTKMAMGQY